MLLVKNCCVFLDFDVFFSLGSDLAFSFDFFVIVVIRHSVLRILRVFVDTFSLLYELKRKISLG